MSYLSSWHIAREGWRSYLHGLISSTYKTIRYSLIAGWDKEELQIASKLYEHNARIYAIQPRNLVLDAIALTRHYRILARCDIVNFSDFYSPWDILRALVLITLLKILSPAKLVFVSHTATDRSVGTVFYRGLHDFLVPIAGSVCHKFM